MHEVPARPGAASLGGGVAPGENSPASGLDIAIVVRSHDDRWGSEVLPDARLLKGPAPDRAWRLPKESDEFAARAQGALRIRGPSVERKGHLFRIRTPGSRWCRSALEGTVNGFTAEPVAEVAAPVAP